METLFQILIVVALLSVAVVLFFGLKNMAVGGSGNTSQKLMRMRILFQMIAIGVLMLGLFIFGQ